MNRFHLCDQQPYWFTKTKENVCVKNEFNSQRIGLVHQYSRRDVRGKTRAGKRVQENHGWF